jgi:ubiquinone/menaquinone biosynthesis C-methylase UbiE
MLSHLDPLNRFSGCAEVYARCRPDYPEEALDYILTTCGLRPGDLVVDVGCGTGIASRQLAYRGLHILGIEPNDDMRSRAEAVPVPAGVPAPRYQPGQAEATGLPDGCAAAVVSAQAFHWFDATAALREFHRILRPEGWVALLWNERDPRNPFTAAYSAVMHTTPGAGLYETARREGGQSLLTSPLFQDAHKVVFQQHQDLDEEGVLGRALSVSYAPKEPEALELFTAALRQAFREHQREGRVQLLYETSVYCGRRDDVTEPCLARPSSP